MMRRQRFVHSLPSLSDSAILQESDSLSVISNSYSYPETIWPQIISPEPDAFIPYYIYPYPLFEISADPISYIPGYINPCLSPDNFSTFDDSALWQDALNNVYSYNNIESCCNTPFGDGFVAENLNSCVDAPEVVENFSDIQHEEPKALPRVTSYGAVSIMLRHLVRIDVLPSKAVYVTNPPAECIVSVNGEGNKSCVIHPNGRVHQIGYDIHMMTLGRQAKICRRGIVFSSNEHCLSYLVDDSGTKTTSEKFRNLNRDFSLDVFYSNGVGQNNMEECYKLVNETDYKNYNNGDEVWKIGELRIKQDERGDVKITRNGDRFAIRTSPTSGQVSIKTMSAEINVGRYSDNYFSARNGDKQVTASLKRFRVQNGTQKAGLNSAGKVVLF